MNGKHLYENTEYHKMYIHELPEYHKTTVTHSRITKLHNFQTVFN